ncbi:hypothetical protein, partial [Actinacidiphila oryziradicis]|uniref:hypothetical protein n=1 Tax=Actinacidiphila oryziradicis TaxID=2571141 RepID=UPI0023F20C22
APIGGRNFAETELGPGEFHEIHLPAPPLGFRGLVMADGVAIDRLARITGDTRPVVKGWAQPGRPQGNAAVPPWPPQPPRADPAGRTPPSLQCRDCDVRPSESGVRRVRSQGRAGGPRSV